MVAPGVRCGAHAGLKFEGRGALGLLPCRPLLQCLAAVPGGGAGDVGGCTRC